MSIGIVGKKLGMTRLFGEDGVSTPVTVIEVQPNRITNVKTDDSDGYTAIQVTTGEKKASRMTKPEAGVFAKAGVEAGRGLWEFRIEDAGQYEQGGDVKADVFAEGQVVDVTGTSKGKGYAGAIKRHNFAGKDATHGNSINHRTPGSIGQCQTPGRVFKGKKMTGHLGDVRTTVQNLKVEKIDLDRNLVLIRGAVPGAKGGDVFIRPAVKG
ncbi:MAG: 50S ribosomal protein L3 [Thiotrichales bacterium]